MDYFDMAESARYADQAKLPVAPIADLRHWSNDIASTPEERNRSNFDAYRMRRVMSGCDTDALALAAKTRDGLLVRSQWLFVDRRAA